MIIIGAGIAGSMARGFFSSLQPEIYEAKADAASSHKAILRFRDPSIGLLLGVPLTKIHVTKAIWYDGHFVEPNPTVTNMYSRKVAKDIYKRSIGTIAPVDRFISREPIIPRGANVGYQLERIEPGICYFSNGEEVEYDNCVSTIPLPVMANAAGIKITGEAKSYPIYVMRFPVLPISEVYQTIYFPSGIFRTYRASLEAQEFVIESQDGFPDELEIVTVLQLFALGMGDVGEPKKYEQSNGKIVELEPSLRKHIILELTDKFSVYSLGRYATWRNITSDVLLDDLAKIASMMKLPRVDRKYAMILEV